MLPYQQTSHLFHLPDLSLFKLHSSRSLIVLQSVPAINGSVTRGDQSGARPVEALLSYHYAHLRQLVLAIWKQLKERKRGREGGGGVNGGGVNNIGVVLLSELHGTFSSWCLS